MFMGSAYKNKGVQLLLDARHALPAEPDRRREHRGRPLERRGADHARVRPEQAARRARVQARGRPLRPAHLPARLPGPDRPRRAASSTAAPSGATRSAGSAACTPRRWRSIDEAFAGDIVAMFGIDCASGDTFTDESIEVAMSSMHVPAPVISLSVKPVDNKSQDNMSKALGRFVREDPTFHAGVDPESGQTIISGMGELHLEVYVERMKREYSVEVADRRAAGGLPRDDLRARRVPHHAQEADRRLGPVRQGRGLHRARRGRVRVRGRRARRRDPDRVHPGGGEGLPRRRSRRAA